MDQAGKSSSSNWVVPLDFVCEPDTCFVVYYSLDFAMIPYPTRLCLMML
jgi:hypothetical protein